MEYIVNWPYRSSLGGPWQGGDRITLDDATAAAINRDSPGVLSPAEVAKQDRMVKGSRTRSPKEATDEQA